MLRYILAAGRNAHSMFTTHEATSSASSFDILRIVARNASSRDGIIHYARAHYEQSDTIQFVHSETGLRTLKDEFDKVVWHNRQHVRDIEKALLTK